MAVPLGFLLCGSFKTLERIVNPPLRFLNFMNPFSLFPLFMLLFGIGELSKATIVFWVAVWPILHNTISGVKTIDPMMIKATHSIGINLYTLFIKVILPAASPSIFHGLKMGAGSSFSPWSSPKCLAPAAAWGDWYSTPSSTSRCQGSSQQRCSFR